jgi:hypothetical protein
VHERAGGAQSGDPAADDDDGGRAACSGDAAFGGQCGGRSGSRTRKQLSPGESGHQGQSTTLDPSHGPLFQGMAGRCPLATLREAAGFGHPAFPQHLMDARSHTQDTARRSTSGQTLPLVVVFLLTLLLFCGAVIDIGNATA